MPSIGITAQKCQPLSLLLKLQSPSIQELAQAHTASEVAEPDSNTGPGDAKPLQFFLPILISEAQNGPLLVNVLGEL